MEAAELEQALAKWLSPLQHRLTVLESQMQSVKPSSEPSPDSAKTAQTELHGLCQDEACEPCVAQGQELVDGAYHQGQHDMLEVLDTWLLMAGGEEFRQKIVEFLARGQKAHEYSQQGIAINA